MNKSIFLVVTLLTSSAMAWDKSPDESFYKKAAEGGISEVEQGKLAQSKGNSAAVKDFGSMMVKDHSQANDKLKALAAKKGVDLPTSSSVGQMATKGKLEILSGDTFDKSYVKGMVADHKEDIKEFKEEAQSGQDAEARAFAKATLPTLKKHLQKIQSIADSIGVKAD